MPRPPHPNDPCIIAARRTPLCRARRGSLAAVPPSTLLAAALDGVLASVRCARTGRPLPFDGGLVEDVCVGNVLGPASGAVTCRMAQLSTRSSVAGGLDASVPLRTCNRQCASGLQAVADVCHAVWAGSISCGIGAGVESMSAHPMKSVTPPDVDWEVVKGAVGTGGRNEAMDCLIPMGRTSDNVCAEYGLNRTALDEFSVRSHARAHAASSSGAFDAEIVPVGDVSKDDGIRPNSSLDTLSQLKPVFSKEGLTTAGNSSQMTDGAAAVLIMSRQEANRQGLQILAVFRGFHACGVPPHLMGVGPAVAVPRVLDQVGWAVNDVDVYEINEAFASQATYCAEVIGIKEGEGKPNLNPLGGAIALGHPLGATGARMVATLVHELQRRGGARKGVVSMCIGTGMGAAAAFEIEAGSDVPTSKL